MEDYVDMGMYYTAGQAATILSQNSGRRISPGYVRQLVRYGKLHPKNVSHTLNLYPKYEVDAYRVEARGKKAGRASHTRSKRQHKEEREQEA